MLFFNKKIIESLLKYNNGNDTIRVRVFEVLLWLKVEDS
jgi:hypothetical protein